MTIIHMVLFKLKASLDDESVKDVCNRMLNLRSECVHPTTQRPYIVRSSGGKDNSIEGMQGGFTHGFVVEFESKEDRDYYVTKDQAHKNFVEYITREGFMEDVRVVDYEVGVF